MNAPNPFFASIGRLAAILFMVSTATFAQTYKGFSVGQYQGQAYNKTGGNTGKGTLDIRSIGANGSVQAYLRDSDGLEGEGAVLAGALSVLGARGESRLPGKPPSVGGGIKIDCDRDVGINLRSGITA